MRTSSPVDAALDAVLAETARSIASAGAAGDELAQLVRDSVAGGKRTRASLLLAAHDGYGGSSPEAAASLAAALELFHGAALIHDDVIDAADTRRGAPSTHRVLSERHASRGWRGESQHFGTASAILAGDLALMAAHRAASRAAALLPRDLAAAAVTRFLDMADLVTAGQFLDLRLAAQPLAALPDQEADIRATMRAKTASYTAEAPLALGAVSAGADPHAADAAGAVGVDLGVAFQLRDDLLGLVGEPQVTGKPTGDDLREGKRTLAVWTAWASASGPQRAAIAEVFGQRDAPDDLIAAATQAVVETGAVAAVEEEIAMLASRARTAIAGLGLTAPAALALDAMAVAATERRS